MLFNRWSPQCTVGLTGDTSLLTCVFTLRDKQCVGPHHSVSAVGCRSCASPDDLINALLVNGRIALWERNRGQGTEVTLCKILF